MPECEICGKSFDNEEDLKAHARAMHPEEIEETEETAEEPAEEPTEEVAEETESKREPWTGARKATEPVMMVSIVLAIIAFIIIIVGLL